MTGAEAMVRCLEREGVSVVFGYPGAAICPFYDKLAGSPVRHVLVRQEQNAGHAASGYARISGKTGVCVATSGPGATNLITAVATSYMDSVPIVAITGQVSLGLLGRDVFQEADITGACAPFVKHSYLVTDARDIPRIFREAFHIASTGRPGPVLIDVPVNIQNDPLSFEYPESVSIRGYNPNLRGHAFQIKKALGAINDSKKPLICAGGGVFDSDAREALRAFAEASGIPVVTTMMGLSVLPFAHPLNYGMVGMYGSALANRAVFECDTLIVIGARLGDRAMSAGGSRMTDNTFIIHIDIDPAEIGKNIGTDIPIVGDARTVVGQLMERPPHPDTSAWRARLDALRALTPVAAADPDKADMREFMRLLSEKTDSDAVVVADVGLNQIYAASGYRIRNGRFITSCGMGTMGYALPAACGVKLAAPERQVVAVMGDGGFQMSMNELATVRQNGLALKLIVGVNRTLGMVRELQRERYDGNYIGVSLGDEPDIRLIAEAYGIKHTKVKRMSEAAAAIDALLAVPDESFLLELDAPDEG